MLPTIYLGGYVHSLSLTQLEHVESAAIYVSPRGTIEWIEKDVDPSQLERIASKYGRGAGLEGVEVVELAPGEFLCPGMVDTHTHAPQYTNIGLGHGVPLLDWLEKLTFPEESKFSDVEYAREVYTRVVQKTLNAGTTTSCYYGTLHLDATKALVDICLGKGQRAMIGKCSMDRNCPDYYVEHSSVAIDTSSAFLDHFPHLISKTQAEGTPLVQPVLTPRMAISTTPALLTHLSSLSRQYDPPLAIQTHLNENHAEIRTTLSLFPDSPNYTAVYDKFGLLGPQTILAHCVHLTGDEREIIARTGAGISHCPTSNFHLDSGVAKVREMLDMGIKVGLGTDCSGGYSLGLLPILRLASHISHQISYSTRPTDPALSSPYTPLSVAEIWYLATMGGAHLCRLDNSIGNFLPGKEFDALRIQSASPGMSWSREGESVRDSFERFLWSGDDRDVREVYVRGRRVGGAGQS